MHITVIKIHNVKLRHAQANFHFGEGDMGHESEDRQHDALCEGRKQL